MALSEKAVPLTGNAAISEAMRQINPDVVAAYPITPQTSIVEEYASFVADGRVDTEMVKVESEHSAMSACIGACLAGARTMTATCSAGLALMWEMLGIASGLRCPIVMPVANRAISAPINIHCDHSDAMGARDQGWIQIYNETAQEAYEAVFLALRIAEHQDVQLPAMVCEDGFITSHCVQNVRLLDDASAKKFAGERKAEFPLLDVKKPVTMGAIELQDYLFETKRQEEEAMRAALKVYLEAGKELSALTGNRYPYFEEYRMGDAQAVIITMSSAAGTTKAVVDRLREQGKKVGLIKLRLFRPFPYKALAKALEGVRCAAVLDRSCSFGANAPLYSEVLNVTAGMQKKPMLQSYVFGLGGRDLLESHIEKVFDDMLSDNVEEGARFIGLR